MESLERIAAELEAGNDATVRSLTRTAIDDGTEAKKILDEGLIAGMQVIGEKFQNHEIFLPDVLLAARAMNAALELLEPLLGGTGAATRGKVVIGTMKGDLHDIGKNLVGIMLGGAGFEVIDLGKDVAPERFVEAAKEADAGVIGMSALLTTTMPTMKDVVSLLRQQGLDGRVKTIVGGAPVSKEFAREIGADAYGFDAANAVERVRGLMA